MNRKPLQSVTLAQSATSLNVHFVKTFGLVNIKMYRDFHNTRFIFTNLGHRASAQCTGAFKSPDLFLLVEGIGLVPNVQRLSQAQIYFY